MWRPEGWKEKRFNDLKRVGGYLNSDTPIILKSDIDIYEAGADAFLEALRTKALKVSNINPTNAGKGIIAFIPDEE